MSAQRSPDGEEPPAEPGFSIVIASCRGPCRQSHCPLLSRVHPFISTQAINVQLLVWAKVVWARALLGNNAATRTASRIPYILVMTCSFEAVIGLEMPKPDTPVADSTVSVPCSPGST